MRPFAEWAERFKDVDGQWAPVQDSVQVGQDQQLRANRFIAKLTDIDGVERELVPATLTRGP